MCITKLCPCTVICKDLGDSMSMSGLLRQSSIVLYAVMCVCL